MSSKPVTTNPPDFPPFAPSYSHISTAPLAASSKLVCFAGQIAFDPATSKIPADFPSQVSLALSNVDRCLTAAGATKEDIVQVRHYVVGLSKLPDEDKKARGEIFTKFMGGLKPPSTLLGVESLATKDFLYEIEVVAVVNN